MTRRGMSPVQGFSLLELLLVVTIMGIMVVLVPSMLFDGVSGLGLRSASRDIAAGLREARAEAVATRRDASVVFDLEKRSYSRSGSSRVVQLPDELEVKLATAQSELAGERQGAIRFFPDGSSTGGRVTISTGERKFEVDVEWLTGRVSIKP